MSLFADCIAKHRAELERAYCSPDRHYHNVQHIRHCLELFEQVREQFKDPGAVEFAVWFHDCIYDPTRSDNEQRSADWAADALRDCAASQEQINRVRALILTTKHTIEPTDPDARLLIDIDLAILGSDENQFDAYERAIRLEYAHVPDEAFAKGRSQILEKFLARPRIYLTDYFRDKFETQAQRNIARSIAKLRTSQGLEAKVNQFDQKLASMGYSLDRKFSPGAIYQSVVIDGTTAYVSGCIPAADDGSLLGVGKVRSQVSLELAQKAAALCAANVLRLVRQEVGSLERVERMLKVLGFVNTDPDFTEHHLVVNGASQLFIDVLGEAGWHARSAVGMAQLPRGVCVEIEAIVKLRMDK